MSGSSWSDHGTVWRSGLWSLERRGDELADISYGGQPVLRSVRAVVRDGDWNTADWSVEAVAESDGLLQISLRSAGYGSDVRGELVVRVSDDRISVRFDAVSHTAFHTNRTGLVVLHPPYLGGTRLLAHHPDGSTSETSFPAEISPHQPVFDIAGLEWSARGLEVTMSFHGDVFEMEDQRNWTDASFKTYSRPLSLPFPYALSEGEAISQRIEVRAVALHAAEADRGDDSVLVLSPGGLFPVIGVAASTAPDPSPAARVSLGSELLVELDLRTPTWRAALSRAAASDLPLDVRVVLDDPDRPALADLTRELRDVRLARVAVFNPATHVSDEPYMDALRKALQNAGIVTAVAGGSRSHFTQLNREGHRLPRDVDEIVTTITPLFHSTSAAQLRESVAMQRLVARQSVTRAGGRPVRIGPISLRPRYNDVATGTEPMPTRSDLSEGYGAAFTGAVDPRQQSPELAAWTVASAASLAVPGVAGMTYFEEWGPRGVHDFDGTPRPAAIALAELSALAAHTLWTADSPDGLVWAVGASTAGGRVVVLAANLDLAFRRVTVRIPSSEGPGRELVFDLPSLRWARGVTGQ